MREPTKDGSLSGLLSNRFFMIDRKREGDELKEEFKVLGSTGNVRCLGKGSRRYLNQCS